MRSLFLCISLLLFCHRLGLLELLNRERGVEFFRIIIQVKQPRYAIGANDEGHHGMAVGVFIVRRLWKREQFFLRLFDAWHVLMVVHLAVAVEDGASGGTGDLIGLRCKRLDRESKRDEILYHCQLVPDFLNRYDAMVKALE